MKRSRRVVLTMMGTAAVGAVSMGFGPRTDCGPGLERGAWPERPALLPPAIRPRRWLRRHAAPIAWRRWRWPWPCAWRRLAIVDASYRLPRARRLARHRGRLRIRFSYHRRRTLLGRARLLRVHAGTDRTADRNADRRHRRHVPRTGRACDRRRKISAAIENTASVLAADLGKLASRRSEPLWPARFQFRRKRPGQAARIQRGYADLDLRSRGVSMDLARAGDRAADHSRPRRPVQFDP